MPFFGKKSQKKNRPKNGPKNGPKVVKNGQNCPKIGETNRRGPENPNESQKYRKNGPKRSHSAISKCTKKVKIGQKWAKINKYCEKVDFPYNNFPEKHISLRTCTHKTIAPSEKTTPATQRLGPVGLTDTRPQPTVGDVAFAYAGAFERLPTLSQEKLDFG